MPISHAANSGAHSLSDRQYDLYSTPPCAVRALLEAEPLPKVIWEPACGRGAIAKVLTAAGHTVYASDLRDYSYGLPGINFLAARTAPEGCQCIVTNPPYRDAQAFVERALELAPTVVMLLRLAFLESERRVNILQRSGLARVHVFSRRLPMMHREGWAGPIASSATAFAWYVWIRSRAGPPSIYWLSWR